MRFENEEEQLDKAIVDTLQKHGILISKDAPPMNKEKALVLVGEVMLEKFVKEFVSLWKDKLFPNCLLRDYEASEQEIYETINSCNLRASITQQEESAGHSASYSIGCKEVNENGKCE